MLITTKNLNVLLTCHNGWLRHYAKQVPKNLKGKSKSSQEWIRRQLADPYIEMSKMLNYRCRSAFKLLEIDDRYHIFKPGDVVIDCGAAPGSWTQVAVQRTNANAAQSDKSKGMVCSTDLLHFHAVPGATIFGGMNFMEPTSQQQLKNAIGNRRVNCVLSDMAPNATGVRMLDQENIVNLCYAVLQFAITMSAQNANLLMKVWDNGDVAKLEKTLTQFYEKARRVKPRACRTDSAELYLLARGFIGTEEARKLLQNIMKKE